MSDPTAGAGHSRPAKKGVSLGVWGPGIFSDDLACDLRDEYRELVADGLSGEEATDRRRRSSESH